MVFCRTLATGVLIGLVAAGAVRAQPAQGSAASASSSASASTSSAAATPASSDGAGDPYLWLEDVSSARALDWVRERNATAQGYLESRPGYPALQSRLTTILNARERIPYVDKHGDYYYNFWRDPQHVRGIWRRTTLAEFRKPDPRWETVLDIDKLAKEEGENWVWKDANCLYPAGQRCLVSLSRGGGDAHVVREFDVNSQRFVKDGFALAEAKSDVAWIDADKIFVATDVGPGSMTTSGYPRTVREWKRGTPLSASSTVFEAQSSDMGVDAIKDFTPGHAHEVIVRRMSFYRDETFLRKDGALVRLDKPDDARARPVRDQLLLTLRSDWTVGGKTYSQGSLIAMDLARFLKGDRDFQVLFQPGVTRSLKNLTVTRSGVLLTELDKVKSRVVELTRKDGRWQRRDVQTPAFGTLKVEAVDPVASDEYFLSMTDFLTPTSLYLARSGTDERSLLKSLPAFFDASPYTVVQQEAVSKDGTRVPYFIVMRKDARLDGKNPTVLYGYGGFEISMEPSYNGITGEAWLKQGGIFVLANIRGGGEFGPRWHQAALKANRQKAFDDFIAVAENLVNRKLTSPQHLGIMGGSNGGLLVGAVMLQRPDLFNAVVCQVPLLDMRRYNRLLAGASWMGEYGDPDDPAQWSYISAYSPYQNVLRDKRYPRVFFTTSTRDDRVHPGHARKMVARMQEQGHDVLYWENTEGGHAGAADNNQRAHMWALTYSFLLQQLKGAD
jgi:prolyl oligopeptidase